MPAVAHATGSWRNRRVEFDKWPWILLIAIVASGMAYSLFFAGHLLYHTKSWIIPGDFWNTFRASQYVTWGGESQIYNNPAAYQTFPGIAVVLAPFVKIADSLNLTAGVANLVPRPSAWLLLGPIQLALGSVLLFPLDALARRFSFSSLPRVLMLLLEAALIWPSVALWGHPEDPLSLALGIYAVLAAYDQHWLKAGVIMGLAIAIQPLILLVVPLTLGCLPVKRWPLVSAVAVTPTILLLASPLIQAWGPTVRILTQQPNFLPENHPTPWISLAPVITPGHYEVVPALKYVKLSSGHYRLEEVMTRELFAPIVAAGPGRIGAILIACLIGLFVKIRVPELRGVVWLAAVALSLRCLVEPVMVPYYLVPGLALTLVVAPLANRARGVATVALIAVCTWSSYRRVGDWDYFLAMAIPLILALVVSRPRSGPRSSWALTDSSYEALVIQ